MSTSVLPVKAERFSFISSWRLNTVYTVFKHHDFFILFILENCTFGFANYTTEVSRKATMLI